jgi:hypothetical protein
VAGVPAAAQGAASADATATVAEEDREFVATLNTVRKSTTHTAVTAQPYVHKHTIPAPHFYSRQHTRLLVAVML